ncbi:hypothetical protein [Aquisalinus flavus]|uniref:Uncharacterized protein n=1 Tax=Aquisalinus flavus TaxID=1526572 RepID=A0A8J2V318_9PROT|nr:hypothetical protein [Aquisalinus flavus]MBD0426176.1 hypothetical protein [Aquisalinus flavus]UNE48249.1 hypothetical protein FF099_09380 [Aquisalinus flavus]GGD09969.1 hypothetical protein GCM10011342_18620 [Aquisalinus flavus]
MIGRRHLGGAAMLVLTGLAACAGTGKAVPAVLVSPDADDIREVERAAEALTGAGGVTLPGDVLTASPELVLDRQFPRSIEGNPAGGRIMERPPRLSLVMKGEQCILVHEDSGKREVLSGVTCAAFAG